MSDCYNTRFFSQRTIDAIMEIWDCATMEGRSMTGAERYASDETASTSSLSKQGMRECGTSWDEAKHS